jgi:hypothetical protein
MAHRGELKVADAKRRGGCFNTCSGHRPGVSGQCVIAFRSAAAGSVATLTAVRPDGFRAREGAGRTTQ